MCKTLPNQTDACFLELADAYAKTSIDKSHLRAVTLALWALKSSWGRIVLAREHNNFTQVTWRAGLAPYGKALLWTDWEGVPQNVVSFRDHRSFIKGWWKSLDYVRPEWKRNAADPQAFVADVMGLATGDADVRAVMNIHDRYTRWEV